MRPVGRNEVHQRRLVPQIVRVIDPVCIGLEPVVLGCLKEGPPGGVEPRVSNVTRSRDVDGTEVERQTDQVVLQRSGHELVDLVGRRARDAADDRAGGLFGIERGLSGLVGIEQGQRIEEGLEQPQLRAVSGNRFSDGVEVGVVAVDRRGQHRVAEAVHGLRELEPDRGVDVGVEPLEDVLESGERG